jgi:pilus assembly protein Flp/PilA
MSTDDTSPRSSARAGSELGATAIEYAIMASLIAVTIVAAVTLLGTAVTGLFAGVQVGL